MHHSISVHNQPTAHRLSPLPSTLAVNNNLQTCRKSWKSHEGLLASEAMRQYRGVADLVCPPEPEAAATQTAAPWTGRNVPPNANGHDHDQDQYYKTDYSLLPVNCKGVNTARSSLDENPIDHPLRNSGAPCGLPGRYGKRGDPGVSSAAGAGAETEAEVSGINFSGREHARRGSKFSPESTRDFPAEFSSRRGAAAARGGGRRLDATAAAAAIAIAGALVLFYVAMPVSPRSGEDEAGDIGGMSQSHGWAGDFWRWMLLPAVVGYRGGGTLFAASAVVAAATAAVGSFLWCAVRLARWREEIFAGSPVVAEALSRAAALDHDERSPASGAASGAGSRPGAKASRPSADEPNDPIGEIFRSGTEASTAFFTPPAADEATVAAEGDTQGGGRSAALTGVFSSPTEAQARARAEGGGGGGGAAVVFLTGVTGLVGQMVLFDLLKQGAACAAGVSCDAGAGGEDVDGGTNDEQGPGKEGIGTGIGIGLDEAAAPTVTTNRLKEVVVLVRGKKRMSARDRLASIRDSPMFRPLRETGAWADTPEDFTDHHQSGPSIAADACGGTENDKGGSGAQSAKTSSPISDSESSQDVCPSRPHPRGARSRPRRCRGATVTVVEGELGKEGLGLTSSSRTLLAEAGVTHSLHCAASVSFSDPLAEAAATNVTGALRVAALVASWPSCG